MMDRPSTTLCDMRQDVSRRVLKVDGYDAAGERVYDRVHGKTCHQCRQKTIGKRTACSECQSADVRSSLRPFFAVLAAPVPGAHLQPDRISGHLDYRLQCNLWYTRHALVPGLQRAHRSSAVCIFQMPLPVGKTH